MIFQKSPSRQDHKYSFELDNMPLECTRNYLGLNNSSGKLQQTCEQLKKQDTKSVLFFETRKVALKWHSNQNMFENPTALLWHWLMADGKRGEWLEDQLENSK